MNHLILKYLKWRLLYYHLQLLLLLMIQKNR
jgi:hypothetical protein